MAVFSFLPHLESFDRGLCECVTPGPQVIQIGRETGFMICCPFPCHGYAYFTFEEEDLYNVDRQPTGSGLVKHKKTCTQCILTAVVATMILILAEVVALSCIALSDLNEETKSSKILILSYLMFFIINDH